MIYPRKLKKRIEAELKSDLAIVVTGMRRVGKTSLLKDVFDGISSTNKLFLDLEILEHRKVFQEESLTSVLRNLEILGLEVQKKHAFLFIDEIQLIKTLPSMIKVLIDHHKVKIVATGSSSYYIKNLFEQSLAGRKMVFHLSPLDFGEFLNFRTAKLQPFVSSLMALKELNTQMVALRYQPLFEEYLQTGGFPQAVLEKNPIRRKALLQDIIDSYIRIDVKALSDIKKTDDLERLITLLPPRIGQKIDYTKLSKILGLSWITVKNYLHFLEDTFVIKLLRPFSKSPDRELSVMPKLFFCDHGLAEALGQISEGQKFENVVFSQLNDRFSLNYYERKSGPEIDFILDQKIGIEAKVFGNSSDLKKLDFLTKDIKLNQNFVFSQRSLKKREPKILQAFLLGFLE